MGGQDAHTLLHLPEEYRRPDAVDGTVERLDSGLQRH